MKKKLQPLSSADSAKGNRILLISIALTVIILALYMQVGNHEFLNYDDSLYVTENPHVSSGITGKNIIWAFASVEQYNWHPVTWLSHMADAQFYGMNPRGHHLTNVFIHALSSLLLLFLLTRFTGSLWQSSFVAFLFALHPLHVESVAWVAERKDVLSAFFCFLTLFYYSGYVSKQKPALYILSLTTFVLGLMSKPMLVTLPIVMLLMDFWPLERCLHEEKGQGQKLSATGFQLKALVKDKIPFFAFSLLSSVITIYAQNRGGAINSLDEMPIWFRIGNALVAYVKYIINTIWPKNLAVFYPFHLSIPIWQVIGSLLLLILVSGATIRVRHRHPYLLVGWFWYLITLVPVIGLIQVGSQSMADRYTYIPLIGLFIMAAWGVPSLARGLKHREGILALLAIAVIIASATLTWQQIGYWQDGVSLFRHALQFTTGNYAAHKNLGLAFFSKGDLDAAIKEYQEALRIIPNDEEVHTNLGAAFASNGDLDAAIGEYQEALHLAPNFMKAHYNLGIALFKNGDLDAAIKEYQEALRINPNNANALYNLGLAFASKGDLDAAIKSFQEALRINPNNANAQKYLGLALVSKGDLDAAIQSFQEAVRIIPNSEMAQKNLADALAQKRMQDETRK
jgi:tetratricopeptide (TPR) repeat protein